MDHEESNPAELTTWFDSIVAKYSEPDLLTARLAAVKQAAARRRVARQVVAAPGGGPLFRRACVEIARHFRGSELGELTLREVSAQTGIPLNDARAVLRSFVDAGILLERVDQPGHRNAPPTRRYRLTRGGGALAGEVVVQAEAPEGDRFIVGVRRLRWES